VLRTPVAAKKFIRRDEEAHVTLWIFLAMGAGVAMGALIPGVKAKDGSKPGEVKLFCRQGRPRLTYRPLSLTGENPPYGILGEVVETSASFEARFRATTLPDHLLGVFSVYCPTNLGDMSRRVSKHPEGALDQIRKAALFGLLAFGAQGVDCDNRRIAPQSSINERGSLVSQTGSDA
jgi:hypothetical protein